MKYFKDKEQFNREMEKILVIMEEKGFLLESDHVYAYEMQHIEAFNDVSKWLEERGYDGDLTADGYYSPKAGAVYGLYDMNRISSNEMHEELIAEAKRQEI